MAERLPRLPPNFAQMPDRDQLLQRYWEQLVTLLEEVPAIQESLADLDTAVAAADAAAAAAQDAADNANAAAADANSAALATAAESSIVNSFPTGFVAPLIESDSTGNITIANHDRQYGDTTLNPTVPVTGATFGTAGLLNDIIRIYYVDPTRAGGAVTYLHTIDPADPPVQGGDIHVVGAVSIPAAGTQAGSGVKNPGYVEP